MPFNSLDKNILSGIPGGSLSIGPFGSLTVSEQTATAQATVKFGLNVTQWVTSSVGNQSSCTAENGILSCSSGISTSGSADIRLRRGVKYRPGQGVIGKFTAVFDPGVEDSVQLAGVGNEECGYYFAKDGVDFGIMHVDTAKREIRLLTLTVGAGASESVTITLNGLSKTFVISGGSNINQTAYLISQQDYSQMGYGWLAEACNGTVCFISKSPRPLSGTYSLSSGGSAAGTFSQVQEGMVASETFISQSLWNIDPMNGGGPSRVSLNPEKGNVYSVGYQYLGFGNAIFSIEDPNKGILLPVHQIINANNRDTTVLNNPYTFARWTAENRGSSTSVTIKGASAATFVEGRVNRDIGPTFSTGSIRASVAQTIVPILTIRPNSVFSGQSSFGALDPYNISVGTDFGNASGNNIVIVYVYKNAALTGPVNFQYVDRYQSITAADYSATGLTVGPKTQLYKSFAVPANDAVTLNLSSDEFFLTHGNTLTIAARATGGTVEYLSTNLSWHEDQ